MTPKRALRFSLLLALLASAPAVRAQAPAPPSAPPPPAAAPLAPAAKPTLAVKPEQVETFTIESKILQETRRINVYFPPGYKGSATRFPLLYMPDGGMEEDFPHVSETVDQLIAERAIPPHLIVGIENTERRRDLTGPTEVESDRKIAPRVGGSPAFREFLRTELMPEVRKRYRVTEERSIVGESLAGYFIVETFLLEPDLFDGYIALSPSLWWNDHRLVRQAKATLAARKDWKKRLYLTSAGEEEADIVQFTSELDQILKADPPQGLAWIYEPRPNEHHGTIFRASEAAAYRWLLGPERPAAPGKPKG